MNKYLFECIDAHTCGNPVRVVTKGEPKLVGATMAEKRLHFLAEFDWIRKGLMFEPRGHDMMSGSMIYPPTDSNNDCGILFIETSGCLPMCGHGTIGTVTVLIQEKIISPKEKGRLRIETPAGLLEVIFKEENEKVRWVRFKNVPSFLAATKLKASCPELGVLYLDVAYGGNFYAIVDPQPNFKGLENYTVDQLIRWSRSLRKELNDRYEFHHPIDPNISGLSHVLWTGTTISSEATARNAVFYGDKAIDRSPCGTGTSARMAQWFEEGKLQIGDSFIHESIIGSQFIGKIEGTTQLAGKPAIIPSIQGWAQVTGYNTIILDKEDPYVEGFQLL